MDLRQYNMSDEMVKRCVGCLNYQPFIIKDGLHTGVANSWLYDAEGGRKTYKVNEFVFDKSECSQKEYERAEDANARLRATYDTFLDEIVEIPWRESWLPKDWYDTGNQKALLCIRGDESSVAEHVFTKRIN